MSTYEAFATFFKGLKMNKPTWNALSKEAQKTWDLIPQKDKNIILQSCPGMSPTKSSNSVAGTQPTQPPSALRSPSTQRQVDFHEVPDSVPSIGDQYQSHCLEMGTPQYDANHTERETEDTMVALTNDKFYTPPMTRVTSSTSSLRHQELLRLMIIRP